MLWTYRLNIYSSIVCPGLCMGIYSDNIYFVGLEYLYNTVTSCCCLLRLVTSHQTTSQVTFCAVLITQIFDEIHLLIQHGHRLAELTACATLFIGLPPQTKLSGR